MKVSTNQKSAVMKKFKVIAILISITIVFVLILSYRGVEDLDSRSVKLKEEETLRAEERSRVEFLQLIESELPVIDKEPRLILLSQFRTGSTLVGDIFNRNPDMFYLFEPLNCIKERGKFMNVNENTKEKLLLRLGQCKFSTKSASCLGNSSLAVAHSKNMYKICRRVTGVTGVECPLASPGVFRRECVKYSGKMAMKVIHADLEEMKEVIEKSNMNIKILHLVRDPRGTANSRRFSLMSSDERRYVKNSKVDRPHDLPIRSLEEMGLFDSSLRPEKVRIDEHCRRMKSNIQTAIDQPEWFKGRYKLLRFEDFARDLLRYTKKIYAFMNESVPPSVLEWIEGKGEETPLYSDSASLSFLNNNNISGIATEWRKYSKFDDIKQTQSECLEVMEKLGYNLLKSEEEIRDFQISVVNEMPDMIPEDIWIR